MYLFNHFKLLSTSISQTNLFDPQMRPKRIPPCWIIEVQEVKTMKA